MRFIETKLKGAFVIEPELHVDERGSFMRAFCRDEFAAAGLPVDFVQCNLSFNPRRGTLRGMHFQLPPREEPKVVRCVRGAAFDAIVDLRPDSPTHRQWFATELTADNRRALFVPVGFAHGFQTLSRDTEICYQMGEFYDPALARGVRWNDPAFGIAWPIAAPSLSERDANFADYRA
jgi:dTDP-4-dehydrorhamnose 3,5-epimerase